MVRVEIFDFLQTFPCCPGEETFVDGVCMGVER